MSNIIEFIERFGEDAQLHHATSAEMERFLVAAGIDSGLQQVLCGDDRSALEALVGVPAPDQVCCLLMPAREEEPEEQEGDVEEDGAAAADTTKLKRVVAL